MKIKSLFNRHRGSIFVLFFVCLLLLLGINSYKNINPNRIEVYDLTWSDKNETDDIIYHRWRYFIEQKTSLPRKIEKSSKIDPDGEYVLRETLVIEYPTEEQIQQTIDDNGF